MHSSIIHEYQRSLTLFAITGHPNVSDGIEFIYNGTILVPGLDYVVLFINSGTCVIREFLPSLKVGDTLQVKIYTDGTKTSLVETYTPTIHPIYSYVRLSGDVTNNISINESTDKSTVLNTPVTIRNCQNVIVNAHHLSTAQIGFELNNLSSPVKINDINATTSDFPKISYSGISALNFTNGRVTNNGVNGITFTEAATAARTAPFSIETTVEGTNTGIDAFLIDGIGFVRIARNGGDINVINPLGEELQFTKTSNTSKYKVEVTTTSYILSVDDLPLVTYPRTVKYSASKGSIQPTNFQTLGTEGLYKALQNGTGYIKASFGQIEAQQKITNIVKEAPNFTFTRISNVCPSQEANLHSLNLTNGIVSQQLEFHTVANPINELTRLTDLEIGNAGIYFAVFKDSLSNCYSASTPIELSISKCCSQVLAESIDGFNTIRKGEEQLYSLTEVSGTLPITYTWTITNGVIVSGQNTPTVKVRATADENLLLQVTAVNCSNVPILKSKNITVISACEKEYYTIFDCFIPESFIITINDVTETNRFISYINNKIKFLQKPGLHDYRIEIIDNHGLHHSIVLKDIIC